MQHLAIIPDGNRRWARQNKLESFLGHKHGMEPFRTAIKACLNNGIQYLSIYTFSLENFNRPEIEKKYLFGELIKEFSEKIPELIEQEVHISFVGNRSFFPDSVKEVFREAEEKTKHLNKLFLNLLFCYGGTAEIINATKNIANQVASGALKADDIDETLFRSALWMGNIPNPDLIIRTGKESRLSNFLLFQAAYSELCFLDCYWPEMTNEILDTCIQKFKTTQRNFGS